jgi:DNA polymerase-3 subunit delta'
MLFTTIKGHPDALAALHNALKTERLAHAYLFVGPSGIGKKRTALALAQAVLCTENPGEGCGTCTACVSITSGSHPDLRLVNPEAAKTTIGIDQVRELQHFLGLKSVRGNRKIAVLEEAHLLTSQAQSALLKMVEEPPGAALLMLLSVNAATLSRPLLSRCQQIRFAALPLAVVEELLVQEHAREPAEARALALYSRGSLGYALSLNVEVFTEERQHVIEELQQLHGASFSQVSRLAEWLVASRTKKSQAKQKVQEVQKTIETTETSASGDRLELVLSWYEEQLRYLLLGQEGVIRYQDCLPAMTQAAQALSVEEALRQLTLVYDTMQALGRNANARLAVEDMLLQISAQQ